MAEVGKGSGSQSHTAGGTAKVGLGLLPEMEFLDGDATLKTALARLEWPRDSHGSAC